MKRLVGGYGGYPGCGSHLFTAELYNPATGTWSSTGSMAFARLGHTATLLLGGKVLVAGGYNDSSGNIASTQVYNPFTGSWSYGTTGSMSAGRFFPTATLLPSGVVLVAGGSNNNLPLSSAELFY